MLIVLTVSWTSPTTRRADLMLSKTVPLDGVVVVGRGQEEGALITNAIHQVNVT
jgi:hypothetical protein